jgi:hypothetical protein
VRDCGGGGLNDLPDATVWITGGVELPQAVLDAQESGLLVFFVGAGASVDSPSDLPLFGGLARQLAGLARVPFDETVAIDFFLGSMPQSFDTHLHARNLIAREGSAPNSTHAALVRVASSVGELRIVTTNFDDHLSSAASAGGIEVHDKWIGPALPLGDDFSGIVHLHGSVLRDPLQLVLTDGDFGKAYLTHAWATRFLLPMFQKFAVVFVGYSHDDPIMRYLALGLPSGTPRYAFTSADDANDLKWTRLGVKPIAYPVQGNDHDALVAALEAWDVRARMGQTEHRARMKAIVDADPTLTPVDRDYLFGRLQTADGAREFAQAAAAVDPSRQVAWLRWIENLPEFKAMFTGQDGEEAARVLGNWFCQNFVTSSELHGAALQTVQRLGQAFHDSLFHGACLAADTLSENDADAGQRWKAFLASSVHGQSAPVVTETLISSLPGERPEHVAVLRAILRPFLVLKRRWSLGDAEELTVIPDAEVRWNSQAETLTGHVVKAVETATPGDLVLGTLLEDSLSAAYDLLDAYHGERRWDGLSYGRSAIEQHAQDQFQDPIDAVIDGLRAYGEKALAAQPDLSQQWWALGRALFRRLALHLVASDAALTSDEKIRWLLDRSALYENDLKHEAYQVLAQAASSASGEARARLLATVQAGPSLPEGMSDRDQHTAYTTYNLLVWLMRVAPDWPEAAAALRAVQAANPTFEPREHLDLDGWTTIGTWGTQLPMEPEDFIRSFDEDPAATLDDLLTRDYAHRSFDQPDWDGTLSLVNRVVETRPDVGERLWALSDERTDIDARADDLHRAIIEGWAKADLVEVADAASARTSSLVGDLESARSISRFLLEQVRKQIDSDDTPALVTMRQIARNLWREQAQSFTHAQGADPVSFAPLYLNSWPGDLAFYWMSEIDRRWRTQRDDWSGLNDEERSALNQLLEGPAPTLDSTRSALASQLFFMFSADSDFATERILPLFLDDATATLAWNPFLHNPRYNDKVLAAGLLDGAIAEWNRLDALGQREIQIQFFRVVASIVSFAGIGPASRQALLDQSVLAGDGTHAAEFAETVARFLSADGIDGAEVWGRWLRDHLASRLNGIPRTAQPEELARWADAVPHLGQAVPQALELLHGHSIGLGDRFFAPHFPDGLLAEHGSALVEHYAERVRNSSPSGHFVPRQVQRLIETIRAAIGDAGAQPLVTAARERGFPGGSN